MKTEITRLIGLGVLYLTFAFSACAEDAKEGEQKIAEFENCPIVSTNRPCHLGYRTYGKLNQDKTNIIIAPTWFGGVSEDFASSGLIGVGKLLDSSKYYIIAIDAFGNGVSSSPSDREMATPAFYKISDMVDAQYALLTQQLNIDHIFAIVGISMGGMQAFEWSERYPGFMDKISVTIGSAKLGAYDQINWKTQIDTVEYLRLLPDGKSKALDYLTGINAMIFYSPSYLENELKEKPLDEILKGERRFAEKGNLDNKISQMKSMLSLSVDTNITKTKLDTLAQHELQFIYAPTDLAVTPNETLQYANSRDATITRLKGDCGHLSLFCEMPTIVTEVDAFLEQ